LFVVLWCVVVFVGGFAMHTVRVLDDEGGVARVAVRLLKKSRRSLYYYGGAGLIGDATKWRSELLRKLETRDFTVKRLIDLKSAKQIQTLLKQLPEIDRGDAVKRYDRWLATHADYLYPKYNNFFYDFEGAPIWRYAVHCLVFDRRNILLVYPSSGMFKNALLIENYPEGAIALADSMEALIDRLGKTPATAKGLRAKMMDKDVQAGRPGYDEWGRWADQIFSAVRAGGWRCWAGLSGAFFLAALAGVRFYPAVLVSTLVVLPVLCMVMAGVLVWLNRTMATLELADSEERFVASAVELLRTSRKSLHYFGGIGLIGDYEGWKRELRKKMQDESFLVKRLIDLGHCRAVVGAVKERSQQARPGGGDASRQDPVKAYEKWVDTQAEFLDPQYNTFVYPADGAPVWKYALHYMVFDESDVALVFPCRGMYKNAIFIRKAPERARALIASIEAVVGFLGLKPLTRTEFEKAASEVPEKGSAKSGTPGRQEGTTKDEQKTA
jgi:hypothetical protein